MAIAKIYTCDLCKEEVNKTMHDGWRIQFKTMGGFKLTYLEDTNASEVIICRKCVQAVIDNGLVMEHNK